MDWIKIRNILFLLATILVLFVGGLFVLEFIIRLTPAGKVIDRPFESKNYYYTHPERVIDISPDVKDGYLSFYGEKLSYWSNELGCFDEPYNGEKPYIYLAGDSITWGYAPFENKWGTIIEKTIGNRVLKCGVSATGTGHQYLKAEEIIGKNPNPKIILVGYFAQNDVLDDYYFPQFIYRGGERRDNPNPGKMPTEETYKIVDEKIKNYDEYCTITAPSHPSLQKIKCYLYRNSALYNLVSNGVKVILGKSDKKDGSIFPDPEDMYEANFESILKFRGLAWENDSKLIFVMIPSREEVYPELFGKSVSKAKSKVMEFMDENDIEYINLESDFKDIANKRTELGVGNPGDLYWNIEWHPSVLGNLAISKSVIDYIYEKGYVGKSKDIDDKIKEIDANLYK
jgi:hypothetical protein